MLNASIKRRRKPKKMKEKNNMEQKMIEYAVSNGLHYDDYFVTIGGVVKFRTVQKNGKEKWFVVVAWNPFKCYPCPER